ncbi:LppU/SCO3897 family protein [Tsukamurella pseudospumae]|uniref:LppU/SCO3897 family protein n=1 Tax=Tsukamurella pseudospumae TaxID=239498 RepID=UPI003CC7F7A3
MVLSARNARGERRRSANATWQISLAIIAGLANSVTTLILLRPILGLFGIAFFIGEFSEFPFFAFFVLAATPAGLAILVSARLARARDAVLVAFSVIVPFFPAVLLGRPGFLWVDRPAGVIETPNEESMGTSRIWVAGSLSKRLRILAAVSYVLAVTFSAVMANVGSGAGAGTRMSSEAQDVGLYAIPSQFPSEAPVTAGAKEAPTRGCANLSGTRSNPRLELVDCDKGRPGYRIVQRAERPNQCPSDVDDRYYYSNSSEQWTACLDYAWAHESCLIISKDGFAEWADCRQAKQGTERPTEVLGGVTDARKCPDGGFAHAQRRFAVCTSPAK